MMDFMDSLRRGVDRAGFELDRLLKANRTRARINALKLQVDDEYRQIGLQAVDLHQRGELANAELRERSERIVRYKAEMAAQELELEAINREVSGGYYADYGEDAPRQMPSNCPSCGSPLPPNAVFCPRCGYRVWKDDTTKSETKEEPPKEDL